MQAESKEERRRKNKLRMRARARKFKKLGLCTYCGTEPAMKGRKYCKKCADYISRRDKLKREERRKMHLCTKCGKPLAPEYKFLHCEECRRKERAWSHGEKYKK